jgi:type I restriction enzyme S subunit
MTPQELKNSILQLAIQGKLVEQRPEEGTGEKLYRQIQTEKQKLIKTGTIKKDKLLPEITEDEKPYDIPESWTWVRIANICSVLNGDRGKNYPSKDTLSKHGIPFISALNLNGITVVADDNLLFMSEEQYQKLGNGKLNLGDVVCCIRGSLGKHGRYPFEKGAIASSLVILRLFQQQEIAVNYLMYYLDSPLFFAEIRRYDNGTAQPNLAAKSLELFCIPLPPLAEQKRIVAKIEDLLPYIGRYEQAWSKLEDFNKRFPTDMQKSILQMAIQGKLVEQRPEEGTGDELYQQIQAEKQKLIKDGTIKKEKPLPETTEDEKPFDIPESWKWVRIGQIFSLQAGKNITASDIYEEQSPEHSFLCYGGNGIRGYVSSNNRSGHYALIGRQGALCGNINFANGDFYATEHAVVVDHFQMCDVLWSGYFLRALNLNQYATATAQPGLAVTNIVQVLIPLPPLAEQKRIVAKLEEILPLCEKLK